MSKFVPALMLLALPAAASAMPISTFLTKADALEKKGPMALFSSDLKLLTGEVRQSAQALLVERAAAEKAGRKPETCIPPKISLGNAEVLAHFRSIPPARRGMSVKDGFAEMMRKKYPCPAA